MFHAAERTTSNDLTDVVPHQAIVRRLRERVPRAYNPRRSDVEEQALRRGDQLERHVVVRAGPVVEREPVALAVGEGLARAELLVGVERAVRDNVPTFGNGRLDAGKGHVQHAGAAGIQIDAVCDADGVELTTIDIHADGAHAGGVYQAAADWRTFQVQGVADRHGAVAADVERTGAT